MASGWTEMWTVGSGASRRTCGIARTEDGYAVDLLRGDTCIASDTYATRAEAERAAGVYRRRYVRDEKPPAAAERTNELYV